MNNEKEIQARIEFKMNEFLTSVKNRLAFKHGQAFDMKRGSNDVWEAFKEVSEALKKEIEMATPYDNMDEIKRREARNVKALQQVGYSANLLPSTRTKS